MDVLLNTSESLVTVLAEQHLRVVATLPRTDGQI